VFLSSPNDLILGGLGSAYIALGLERELLHQMDLRNGVDATLGGGGGTFWHGLGPVGPTWLPLGPHLGMASSRTFPCICHGIIP
jgi:hypothetical protein